MHYLCRKILVIMRLYHGTNVVVTKHEIRIVGYTKDFGYGFYCTNYVEDYLANRITREAFWALARFKHPTHQLLFCNDRALQTLTFIESYEL